MKDHQPTALEQQYEEALLRLERFLAEPMVGPEDLSEWLRQHEQLIALGNQLMASWTPNHDRRPLKLDTRGGGRERS